MMTGMLWYDNDPKTTLAAKIERAADYYQKKYGRVPDVCLVHPAPLSPSTATAPQIDNEHVNLGGMVIEVRAVRFVLPGHLWLGMDETRQKNGERH